MNNNSQYDILTTNSSSNCAFDKTQIIPTTVNGESNFIDVFLGGSCETNSTWREDIAVPLVKKHGLTYYNPALRELNEEEDVYDYLANSTCLSNGDVELVPEHCKVLEQLVLNWKRTLNRSRVLLFVITNDTRSLTTMVLAAHYIGLNKNVVLSIQQLPVDECEISNEKVGFSCSFQHLIRIKSKL